MGHSCCERFRHRSEAESHLRHRLQGLILRLSKSTPLHRGMQIGSHLLRLCCNQQSWPSSLSRWQSRLWGRNHPWQQPCGHRVSTSSGKICRMTKSIARELQKVNKRRLKYIAKESTYRVLLTGSPTRPARLGKCMRWHTGRRRSSKGCWSSWWRQVSDESKSFCVSLVSYGVDVGNLWDITSSGGQAKI